MYELSFGFEHILLLYFIGMMEELLVFSSTFCQHKNRNQPKANYML